MEQGKYGVLWGKAVGFAAAIMMSGVIAQLRMETVRGERNHRRYLLYWVSGQGTVLYLIPRGSPCEVGF